LSNGFKIIELADHQGPVSLDIPPDRILYNNIGQFSDLLMIGTLKDEGRLALYMSYPNLPRAIAEMEQAKKYMLEHLYG